MSDDAAYDSPVRDAAMPAWVKRAIIWFWVGALGAFYAVGMVRALRGFLLVILVSLFLSFAIEPAVNRLERYGIRRGYGTGIVFLAFVATGIGIIAMIGAALASEIRALVEKAPEYIDSAERWINLTFNTQIEFDTIRQEFVAGGGVEDLVGRFADDVVNLGTTLASLLFQMFTVALFTFYLVAQGPQFRSLVSGFLSDRHRALVLQAWDLAIEKSGAYIYSRTALAAVSAAFHWLVFTLLGVPSPLALAIWVGLVSQFIPAVGTYFAGALPLAIALLHEPRAALWTLVALLLYQQLENYVLSPRITAHTMDIHVAVAFGSVIIGLALLGAVGALLALPFAATAQAFVSSWRAGRAPSATETAEPVDDSS